MKVMFCSFSQDCVTREYTTKSDVLHLGSVLGKCPHNGFCERKMHGCQMLGKKKEESLIPLVWSVEEVVEWIATTAREKVSTHFLSLSLTLTSYATKDCIHLTRWYYYVRKNECYASSNASKR
ncbi:hypothetical protein GIB67_027244 [Kingdonia uniflora]|uniref:Uncharacterized protein n=1 Tax=Kingdonia uniflora TaxID=39325 RepID=A0A7J7KYC1_9MAGN|nr:hypothetical protein GIB67_027244 [Kingdonia uniflora]